MSKKKIRRGDVFLADLNPVVGSEEGGNRPVLIVQNNTGNRNSRTTIVAPITRKLTSSYLPVHVIVSPSVTGLQETSTDTLPFYQVRNNGEKPKYYVNDTHEPIISKEDFDAVQKLISDKAIPPEAKYRIDSPMKKKIICGKCGAKFGRRSNKGNPFWTCRTHNQMSKDKCNAKPVPETQFQLAFIRMFNKLATHYQNIITPAYRQLQRLSDIGEFANTQVAEIRKEIAEQKAQCHLFSQLNAQGVLDSVYYTSRSQELDRNLVQLHKQLHAILNSDEDEERLAKIKKLISIFESSEQITEFNEEKFSSIVERIIVLSEKEIRFELICGIAFNEPIQRKGR